MDRCLVCPGRYRPIPGSGPQPARIMLVGERPGETENREGVPFVGKAGQELDDTYLPLADLDRRDVRVTNAVKCWADNNKTPTDRELLGPADKSLVGCAAHFLPSEIRAVDPEIIVLLGGTACKLAPDIRLDTHHGYPQQVTGFMGFWDGWVLPMYHPALGMHETSRMTQLLEDFERAGKWLAGSWKVPEPISASQRYELLHGELNGMHPRIAIDTESHGGKPWSIQWSGYQNTGYMLLTEDERGIGKFSAWMHANPETEVILHNAPGDLDTLARLGVQANRFQDTMQQAYHLCSLPQGLKPLVYRLFGHTMRSWEDVVWPASRQKALEWMCEALAVAELDLRLLESTRLNTKIREKVKAGPAEQALNRIIRCSTNPEYDIWDKVRECQDKPEQEWQWQHIAARCGPLPILGIGNCTLEEAVQYGCSDADWTGRLAAKLSQLRGDPKWTIPVEDHDSRVIAA